MKLTMNNIMIVMAMFVLKTARACIMLTMTKKELDTYNAIIRQKLIDKGINYG